MTPLPPPLGSGALMLWRIDDARFARDWQLGIGAARFGGRWNSVGIPAIYAALEPATAMLEVAVHKGFRTLDILPHVLTAATIVHPATLVAVTESALPDPGWLQPGNGPRPERQRYGDTVLARHGAFLVPSSVSRHSWNLVMLAGASPALADVRQEPLIIDPRLHGGANVAVP